MIGPSYIKHLFASWFQRDRLEEELDDELRFHLEMQESSLMAGGLSPEEARREARLRFGHVSKIKEDSRDQRAGVWLEHLGRDYLQAFRYLLKDRFFALASVLTLSLGIAFSTAVYSLVRPVLVGGLPFKEADSLVFVHEDRGADSRGPVAYESYKQWLGAGSVFSAVETYEIRKVSISTSGGMLRYRAGLMTPGLFPLLGVAMHSGRSLMAADQDAASPAVCLLGHRFWLREYGGDPGALGSVVVIDGNPVAVVGICAQDTAFESDVDVWLPLTDAYAAELQPGRARFFCVGRLAPGVDPERVPSLVASQSPVSGGRMLRARVTSLRDHFSDKRILSYSWLSLASALAVLGVAVANVGLLALSRGLSRAREFAVKTALGAGFGRNACRLAAEYVIVACVSALVGLGLSFAIVAVVSVRIPDIVPSFVRFSVDWGWWALSALLSCAGVVACGLVPLAGNSGALLRDSLGEKGGDGGMVGSRGRLRSALVFFEVAFAATLVFGTGALAKAVMLRSSADCGLDPSGLSYFELGDSLGAGAQQRRSYLNREVCEALSLQRGIKAAALCSYAPFGGSVGWLPVVVEGKSDRARVRNFGCTPGYFETAGIALLEGRDFAWGDRDRPGGVAIVDNEFVRRHFPGGKALGRTVALAGSAVAHPLTIVGVVSSLAGSRVDSFEGSLYLPLDTLSAEESRYVLLRSERGGWLDLSLAARRVLNASFRGLAFGPPISVEQTVQTLFWKERMFAFFMGVFSLFALLLSSVGLAGVVAYSVVRRTHEIGVRSALGASTADVLRLVMGQGILLVLSGLCFGGALFFTLASVLPSPLSTLFPGGAASLLGSLLLFVAVSAIACYLPARKAARTNPMRALRAD